MSILFSLFAFACLQMECLEEELSTIFPSYSYCMRITSQEFDEQKISVSQAAVAELLENIIKDRNLSLKEKKKKLKQVMRLVNCLDIITWQESLK